MDLGYTETPKVQEWKHINALKTKSGRLSKGPFNKDPRIQQIIDDYRTTFEDRPLSRRGVMSTRQSTLVEERPYTQQSMIRPMTGSKHSAARPPSASIFSERNTGIPRTASRLTNTMMQQPPSRAGTAINLTGTQVSALERPITQQGLSGLRTSARRPQTRQVLDKRYFEGLLQMKIRELSTEVGKLTRDIENQTREQATFLIYDKRVKEMASELTEFQGQLADLNLVVDKLNTDTEKGEVDAECEELRALNDKESHSLELLFAQRQQKDAQLQMLEKEIEQEHHMTDNLLAAMSPELKSSYTQLQQTNSGLQHQMEELQQELDVLTSRKSVLEDQLSISQVKQEAVRLHHKLREAESRRNALLEEEQTRSTPAQEREQLLHKVREDNAEMATMDRQITEIKDTLSRKQEELDQVEKDLVDSQSERHQKYRELRRREETMEQFLSSFDQSREEERARIEQLEGNIVAAMEEISRHLAHSEHLPSSEDFSVMKENLSFKEGELDKSRNTMEGLSKEQQQLTVNLQKVEALEEKITKEMEMLKTRMVSMTEELTSLSDLDSLRVQDQAKRAALNVERQELEENKGPVRTTLQKLQENNKKLQKQLNDNETHAQLSNLERKLAQLEQNNFAIKEFVASKKSETDYDPLKVKVFAIVKEYNTLLKEHLKTGGSLAS
uniref:Uncharacterized protein n=1 Tax=Timema cristinae TaxID=61476 RepID=A0A7R9GVA5_TIMCR|nr:unnamed protein product [Timema cristinae]